MMPYATTKLSSKGQVVIPEEVRNDLGLKEGDQIVVGSRSGLKNGIKVQPRLINLNGDASPKL